MKVFLVVLAIFVVAVWANEDEEQDETELMELEDPHYYPKDCGTKLVCTYKRRCGDKFILKTVCRKYCGITKKCTKHYSHHYDPYVPYFPPKKHCVPVKVSFKLLCSSLTLSRPGGGGGESAPPRCFLHNSKTP